MSRFYPKLSRRLVRHLKCLRCECSCNASRIFLVFFFGFFGFAVFIFGCLSSVLHPSVLSEVFAYEGFFLVLFSFACCVYFLGSFRLRLFLPLFFVAFSFLFYELLLFALPFLADVLEVFYAR